jgi:hypothetical protein
VEADDGLLVRPDHTDAWPLSEKAAVTADISAWLLLTRSCHSLTR